MDDLSKFVSEFIRREEQSLFSVFSFVDSSASNNQDTSLTIDDINKAWDLVKDIPPLPFDEVWIHPKAEMPEFVKTEEFGEGDERFVLHSLCGIPVLAMDNIPKNKMFFWKKGSFLKGELPSLVMIVDLET